MWPLSSGGVSWIKDRYRIGAALLHGLAHVARHE
jgi:hypothetical protein